MVLLAAALAVAGCTLIPDGTDDTQRNVYLIAPQTSPPASTLACGSIQVSAGTGASGFRTSRMAYMRTSYQLEYFAYSVWADNPARMLGEAVRLYLHDSGAFDAVVSTPAAAATDMRLDLSDGKVLQRFSGDGSQIEMTLEARLYASARPQQLLGKRFTVSGPAEPDPEGGVRAANDAAARLVADVYAFVKAGCADVAEGSSDTGPG